MRKVRLTADIWQRSLIRGAWEKDFSPLWNDYNRTRGSREAILASLSKEFPNFTQSCQNFIHNPHKFSGDKAARNRLDQTEHAYYLGKPYFEDNIREKILTIPTKNGTLHDDLNLLAAKRSEGEVKEKCVLLIISRLFMRPCWELSGTRFGERVLLCISR